MSRADVAVIAGGGTGGHLVPAIAVADALVAAGVPREGIRFIGSRRGQDAAILAPTGYAAHLLPGRGIRRSLAPSALAANAAALAGLAAAVLEAGWILLRRRPRVVVSVGGYASLPAAIAGALLRIPLVVVNTDAVPGAANRLVGRLAAASAVAFEGTDLPRAVVTGTPVRAGIRPRPREASAVAAARRELGVPETGRLLACFGGSLGARRINEAALGLDAAGSLPSDVTILHLVGRRDWGDGAAWRGTERYVARPFEDRMHLVYEAADLVVCRAGAMTVAELALAGVPAILVPLPGAPGDHQRRNAAALEGAGGAEVLDDAQCTPAELADRVGRLLADPERLEAMGAAAGAVGRPEAAAAIARVVMDHGAEEHP